MEQNLLIHAMKYTCQSIKHQSKLIITIWNIIFFLYDVDNNLTISLAPIAINT